MPNLPVSVFTAEVEEDGPVAWWRLGNPAVVTTGVDLIGGRHLTYTDNPRGGQSLVFGDRNESTSFDHPDSGSGNVAEATTTMPFTAYPFTFEAVFRSAKSVDNTVRFLMQIGNGTHFVDIYIADTASGGAGELQTLMTADAYATASFFGTSGVRVDDKSIHHVVLSFRASDDVECWIDGVFTALGGSTATVALPGGTVHIALGNISAVYPGAGEFGLDGELQDVVLYDYILSDSRIAAHASAASAPWAGDTTGERIGRILDLLGWPSADRDIDTGESTLQAAELNMSGLDHMQLAAETEYGEFFAGADGAARFISRHAKWKPPYNTPIGTLSDDGADVGYSALRFTYGTDLVRNRVTISNKDGLTYTANSTASQDSYQVRAFSKMNLIGDTDSDVVGYANYLVSEYDEPLLQAEGVTVLPQRDPATYFPIVLAADLVYQVNVERTPQGVGSAIDQSYTIEGISHHITPKFWRTEFRLSPADSPGVLILDSTSQGRLDTNVLGF